jgi:hypothetical protein
MLPQDGVFFPGVRDTDAVISVGEGVVEEGVGSDETTAITTTTTKTTTTKILPFVTYILPQNRIFFSSVRDADAVISVG